MPKFINNLTKKEVEINKWEDLLALLLKYKSNTVEEFNSVLNGIRNSPQFPELYKTEEKDDLVTRWVLNDYISMLRNNILSKGNPGDEKRIQTMIDVLEPAWIVIELELPENKIHVYFDNRKDVAQKLLITTLKINALKVG